MSNFTKKRQPLIKPEILKVNTVAYSNLFKIETVDLKFHNGALRCYERLSPSTRQSVMIVPVIDNELILIHEYAVGIENYELGFPKGLIDQGEEVLEAANRELMEEVGFAAKQLEILMTVSMSPSYLSSTMHIVLARELYPQSREGDEPEPLIVTRWPIEDMLALINEPDFREARNVSALFLTYHYLNNQSENIF